MEVRKIEGAIALKLKMGDTILYKVGTPEMICDAFGIDRPLSDSAIPKIVGPKFGGSARLVSIKSMQAYRKKISDSNIKVVVI